VQKKGRLTGSRVREGLPKGAASEKIPRANKTINQSGGLGELKGQAKRDAGGKSDKKHRRGKESVAKQEPKVDSASVKGLRRSQRCQRNLEKTCEAKGRRKMPGGHLQAAREKGVQSDDQEGIRIFFIHQIEGRGCM